MGRLRFSLLGLFGVVTLAAVNFAALRYAPEWWAASAFTVAVGALLFAVLGAMFRRGEGRAFWAGFGTIGLAYLCMSTIPWLDVHVGEHLVTTKVLGSLHARLITALNRQNARRRTAERTIRSALDRRFTGSFRDASLSAVARAIAEEYEIKVLIDRSIDRHLRVNADLARVSLRSSLRLMLKPHDAVYWIDDGMLKIGSENARVAAESRKLGIDMARFAEAPQGFLPSGGYPVGPGTIGPSWIDFARGGHSLLAILLGMLDGLVARHVYNANECTP